MRRIWHLSALLAPASQIAASGFKLPEGIAPSLLTKLLADQQRQLLDLREELMKRLPAQGKVTLGDVEIPAENVLQEISHNSTQSNPKPGILVKYSRMTATGVPANMPNTGDMLVPIESLPSSLQ
jgi:hypothetical protein